MSAGRRAQRLEAVSSADDSRPFGVPAQLIRQLVGYYICEGSLDREQATVFETVLSTICGLRVHAAVIRESRHRRLRSAVVSIESSDAPHFERMFPASRRLHESAGRIAYRLSGSQLRRG
jgi:hypothetical protein